MVTLTIDEVGKMGTGNGEAKGEGGEIGNGKWGGERRRGRNREREREWEMEAGGRGGEMHEF
jgi:hypothetical protein